MPVQVSQRFYDHLTSERDNFRNQATHAAGERDRNEEVRVFNQEMADSADAALADLEVGP